MKSKTHDLGSAKHGTGHWWHQRVTALALIVLLLYTATTFISSVIFDGGYEEAVIWLSSPFSATFVILFILVAFYHAVLGLQVIIEDYVHSEGWKIFSLLAVKFTCAFFALLGVLSVLKILFWSLLPNGEPPA